MSWRKSHVSLAHGFTWTEPTALWPPSPNPRNLPDLNQADSLSLDPHKWLYQPLDCGCLLYRDAGAARRAFSHTGDYAKSLVDDPVEGFAFFEETIELSRRFRALKLWLSFRYHGLEKFREAIRNDLAYAQLLAGLIAQQPELEVLAPVTLSAVCFRYRSRSDADGDGDDFNQTGLAAREPPGKGILVQRDDSWPLRIAGLRRQSSHHSG